MAEDQGVDDDAFAYGIVNESVRLAEVLARAVANTYEDLADFSAHVVAALARNDDERPEDER